MSASDDMKNLRAQFDFCYHKQNLDFEAERAEYVRDIQQLKEEGRRADEVEKSLNLMKEKVQRMKNDHEKEKQKMQDAFQIEKGIMQQQAHNMKLNHEVEIGKVYRAFEIQKERMKQASEREYTRLKSFFTSKLDSMEEKLKMEKEKMKDKEKVMEKNLQLRSGRINNWAGVKDSDLEKMIDETSKALEKMRAEERRRIDEKLICAICVDNMKSHVLIPCGHRFCEVCINRLHQKVCPICKIKTQSVFRCS